MTEAETGVMRPPAQGCGPTPGCRGLGAPPTPDFRLRPPEQGEQTPVVWSPWLVVLGHSSLRILYIETPNVRFFVSERRKCYISLQGNRVFKLFIPELSRFALEREPALRVLTDPEDTGRPFS